MKNNCKYCEEGIPVSGHAFHAYGIHHDLWAFDKNRNIPRENKRSGNVRCGPEDDFYEIPYYYGELK